MNPRISLAGGVLTILGGFLILLVGAVVAYIIGAILSGVSLGGTLTGFLALGPILGVLVILMGILALALPDLNAVWGALAIVFSTVSLFTDALGGVFLGFLLALIGGIPILVKKAPLPTPMIPPPPPRPGPPPS